ncbi:MAG: hypothetical protein HY877_00480 [Deltaproteobacteria bacterium]|nr:hypothetical protein [Deltaproteobacteria bacterium]
MKLRDYISTKNEIDACTVKDGQGNVVADKAEGTPFMSEIAKKCKESASTGSGIIDFKNKVNKNLTEATVATEGSQQ